MTPFWNRLLGAASVEWIAQIKANQPVCEARRPFTRKPKATGTIDEAACLCLRALVERVGPSVCVEIGTFIGTSALVLASTGGAVYTCDKDNAVLESDGPIIAFGKTSSTTMLEGLASHGLKADLFFFDGRIQDADLKFIAQLSSPDTVFAFDDYDGHDKGVINVDRLTPHLLGYRLERPAGPVMGLVGRSTIAVLVPEGWR